MATLADHIEAYLKQILAGVSGGVLEIHRSDLAARFDCVPSQINYVLATRFTPDRGYVVETRRGGGGYIRIVRCAFCTEEDLYAEICRRVGQSLSQAQSEALLLRLVEAGAVTARDATMVRSTLQCETAWMTGALRDIVRARLLRAVLFILLQG